MITAQNLQKLFLFSRTNVLSVCKLICVKKSYQNAVLRVCKRNLS